MTTTENTGRPFNLPEYFLLLALDSGGRFRVTEHDVDMGLAGAVLADLARRGRIVVTENRVEIAEDPASILDAGDAPEGWQPENALEHPLDRVLSLMNDAPEPMDAEQWVNRLATRQLREVVVEALVERGAIQVKQIRRFGLLKRTRHFKNETFYELDLKVRLGVVMNREEPLDLVTWPLLSLMHVTGLLERLSPESRRPKITDLLEEKYESLESAQEKSIYESLHAVENAISEQLVATRGGPSGLNA